MNPFTYAMRSRQIQIDKERERDSRNQIANTQRIMSQQTAPTNLYNANQNDSNARLTRDIAKTLKMNREIEKAKREFESEIVRINKK